MFFKKNSMCIVKKHKKAQITLFVIVALIILLGIILSVSFLKNFNSNTTVKKFSLIQDNFQFCFEKSLKDTLKVISKNGGYYILKEKDFNNAFQNKGVYFNNDFFPYYNFLDENCNSNYNECLKTYIPTLKFIEKELSYYTNKNTESCLKNVLENYNSNTTDKILYDNFKVDSKIYLKDDVIKYSSVLKGSFKKNSDTKNSFSISDEINSDFKQLYDVVKAFSSFEYKTGFLEYYILDIISLNSGVGKKYPPFYSFDFSYNIDFWNSISVSNILKEDINKQFSILRFSSSEDVNNMKEKNIPLFLKKYFVTLKKGRSNVFLGDVAFLNFISAPKVNVKFNSQSFVKGEKINMPVEIFSSIIPIRVYSTKYDVKTPLLFSVRSKNSDLIFNFALEANIKHNSPVKNAVSSFNIQSYNENFNNDNNNLDSKEFLALQKIKNSNFYCNKPLGNKIKVSFYDENNNVLNNDFILNFFCGLESCYYNVKSGNTFFIPQCYNAKLSFKDKNNVYDFNVFENYNSLDNSFYDEFKLQGFKKHKLDLKINVYDLLRVSEREAEKNSDKLFKDKSRLLSFKPDHYNLSDNKRFLEDDEFLILTFKKLNSDFFYNVKLSKDNFYKNKNIFLYPGEYSLNIILLKNLSSPFYIPKRESCIVGNPDFICIGRQTFDKVEFKDSFVEFSYNFNESNPFILEYNSIKDDDGVLEFDIPAFSFFKVPESERFVEDLSFMDYGSEIFLTNNFLGVKVK